MKTGERCTACEGDGEYINGDWSTGYPKTVCQVCRGRGRMERDPVSREWKPAKEGAEAKAVRAMNRVKLDALARDLKIDGPELSNVEDLRERVLARLEKVMAHA